MVASIAQMARGQEDYYLELAQEDYYLNGGEPPGKWTGKGAEKLGLSGTVQGDDLKAILAGFMPESGRKLVQNAGKEDRQVGWDMAFSAPKSVSVVWGIANDEQRKQIEAAHHKAVESAIGYLEQNALFSRRGEQGRHVVGAEAVVSTFLHGTSRDQDPNLHTHALFSNVGVCADGKTRTLVSKQLYLHKMVAGALYRAVLAGELNQKQGFELAQVESWFEVKGISKQARDHFSKRRMAIEEAAGPGANSKKLDAACLATRAKKGHVARDVLADKWREEAAEFGLDQQFVDNLFQGPKTIAEKKQAKTFEKAIDKGIEDLSETESFFTVQQLLRKALEQVQTGKVELDQAMKVLDRSLKENQRLFSLGTDRMNQYLTSQELKDSEQKLLQSASELFDRKGKTVSFTSLRNIVDGSVAKTVAVKAQAFVDSHLPECLRFKLGPQDYQQLNEEQRKALRHITAEKGSLKTVSGRAGTGKTTMLAAAREAWESKGLKVVGCATSGKAAQELAQNAGINSETVRLTLMRLEKDRLRELKRHVRQLVREFWNKPTYQPDKLKLDRKTVLVVDEASMVGTRDLESLLEHANKAGAKVVLVGDHRQLPSVDAGSAFSKLFKATQGRELTESVRQKKRWLRDAADLLAEGDQRGSLIKFAINDRLSFQDNEDEAKSNLVQSWVEHQTKDLKESVILASTNRDVDDLNLQAQDERRRKGELGNSKLTFNGTQYHSGDRIAFHRIDRKLGVWNGDRGTIKHILNPINRYAARFVIELDRGETVTICPGRLKEKSDISLGYASTVHKSQGMTVDKAFVLLDRQMTSQQTSYVALTRSRHDTFISAQTDQVEEDVVSFAAAQMELEQRLARDRAKITAFEQKQQMEQEAQRQRYQRVQEMHIK